MRQRCSERIVGHSENGRNTGFEKAPVGLLCHHVNPLCLARRPKPDSSHQCCSCAPSGFPKGRIGSTALRAKARRVQGTGHQERWQLSNFAHAMTTTSTPGIPAWSKHSNQCQTTRSSTTSRGARRKRQAVLQCAPESRPSRTAAFPHIRPIDPPRS